MTGSSGAGTSVPVMINLNAPSPLFIQPLPFRVLLAPSIVQPGALSRSRSHYRSLSLDRSECCSLPLSFRVLLSPSIVQSAALPLYLSGYRSLSLYRSLYCSFPPAFRVLLSPSTFQLILLSSSIVIFPAHMSVLHSYLSHSHAVLFLCCQAIFHM